MRSAGLTIVAKVAIATSPAVLRGHTVLCVLTLFPMIKSDIRISVPEGNVQKEGPIFYTCYAETLFAESKLIFFILSGSLLLRESSLRIVNCLKSFDFKLFFVYTLHLLRGPYWSICTKFLFNFNEHMTCFRIQMWL